MSNPFKITVIGVFESVTCIASLLQQSASCNELPFGGKIQNKSTARVKEHLYHLFEMHEQILIIYRSVMRTILILWLKLNKDQTFEGSFQCRGFCTQDAVFKNRYNQSQPGFIYSCRLRLILSAANIAFLMKP